MIWHRPIRIEFNHCDPAGIVFYPRYFEMTNSVAENFFREVAGLPYEVMMAGGNGVPLAQVTAEFHAPSRLGEVLDWQLSIERIGRASITCHIEAHHLDQRGAGSHRLTAGLTLVYVDGSGQSHPWPEDVRARIIAFQEKP
ncbi:thioesterase family protein [Gemmobacter sp. 24YEA27]|uniref:acyl-CoA thioesterase n=1 Tax=Gemmobacter sp. 24YEA27 TaxID=3040672 RepID=UPI0024B3692A|nr:thioesterase family protein [Gemmobacter sp. 24YEA27]